MNNVKYESIKDASSKQLKLFISIHCITITAFT